MSAGSGCEFRPISAPETLVFRTVEKPGHLLPVFMRRRFLPRHRRAALRLLASGSASVLTQQSGSTDRCYLNVHRVGPAGIDLTAVDP